MKLLTRKEIIKIWNKQSEEKLNTYCCPDCRDLLYEHNGVYECINPMCSNDISYYIEEKT